jgi:hypothetical protein
MTEAALGFIDNLGISYGLVLLMSAGFVIGSVVWFAWGPGLARDLVFPRYGAGRMDIREFLTRVTLRSTQGRLFLCACALNLALAAALPFMGERVRDPIGMAWVTALFPIFLFAMHCALFLRIGVTWFTTVMLTVFALLPAWKIFVVDIFGIR